MERIVYLLGAGFSAPLGLPVMSNFLEKSKDLYFSGEKSYEYFMDVLQEIHKMSTIKNYYFTNLSNIEEILSVLEMQQGLNGDGLKGNFLRYIADVINHFTPTFAPRQGSKWAGGWHQTLFSAAGHPHANPFGTFVASMLQLRISATARSISPLCASSFEDTNVKYAIITLNYDLVLERLENYIDKSFVKEKLLSFEQMTTVHPLDQPSAGVPLAKLHGSADTGVMVAPTWNKTLAKNLVPAWKSAFDLLAKANHIRIIGYSLPTVDAYIKYLLRAAAIESQHLKTIDVLCRDDHKGSVQARYAEFIDFPKFRFVNGDVLDYLGRMNHETYSQISVVAEDLDFRGLEPAHEAFFVSMQQ